MSYKSYFNDIKRLEASLARLESSLSSQGSSLGIPPADPLDIARREMEAQGAMITNARRLIRSVKVVFERRLDSQWAPELFTPACQAQVDEIVSRMIGHWLPLEPQRMGRSIMAALQTVQWEVMHGRHWRLMFETVILVALTKALAGAGHHEDFIIVGNHLAPTSLIHFLETQEVLTHLLEFVDTYTYGTRAGRRALYLDHEEKRAMIRGFFGFLTPVLIPDDVDELISALPAASQARIRRAI